MSVCEQREPSSQAQDVLAPPSRSGSSQAQVHKACLHGQNVPCQPESTVDTERVDLNGATCCPL